jgi:hypothetical protein
MSNKAPKLMEEEAVKLKNDGYYIESLDKYDTLIELLQKSKSNLSEVNSYSDRANNARYMHH